MAVVFGPWVPDQPDVGNGWERLEEAKNVLPKATGYDPFPEAVPFGSSVTASACTGAYAVRDLSNTGYTFAGTANGLYKMSATGAWDNVNRTATYSTLSTDCWRFNAFGNTLVAVNGVDAMQFFTMGTSTRFLDMSGSASAPIATYIATVRDFMFAGRISNFNNRVQWSHINNPTRWSRSQQNQADYQDLPGDGGNVIGITGGDFATVLTDRSVWRASYIGAPLVFRFDELGRNTGCIAAGSVARYQNVTFFLSSNGFMAFDGQQAVSIGDEGIDDWFFENAASSYFHRMSSTIDPDRKLWVVSFASVNSTDGTPDKLLIYNFESQRWSNAEHSLDVLFSSIASGGYTLEQLDAFGTLETLPYSLDSDQWAASKQNILAGINSAHKLVTFSSATPKAATLITGERNISPGLRSLLTEIRPLMQGGNGVSVSIGKRERLGDAVTWSTTATYNSIGLCPVRVNSRFHRVRVDTSGDFERLIGFDFRAVREGRR